MIDTTKKQNPIVHFTHPDLHPAMRAFIASMNMPYRFRKGWLEEGRDIPPEYCETVAEHIYGMWMLDEIIQCVFPEFHARFNTLLVYELIKRHEHCEILGEDYTPNDGIDREEKDRRERASLKDWLKMFENNFFIQKTWESYQNADSVEAQYVHVLDYMQRIIRARVYEKEFDKDLSQFYKNRSQKIPEPLLSFFETILL